MGRWLLTSSVQVEVFPQCLMPLMPRRQLLPTTSRRLESYHLKECTPLVAVLHQMFLDWVKVMQSTCTAERSQLVEHLLQLQCSLGWFRYSMRLGLRRECQQWDTS